MPIDTIAEHRLDQAICALVWKLITISNTTSASHLAACHQPAGRHVVSTEPCLTDTTVTVVATGGGEDLEQPKNRKLVSDMV